MDPQSHHALGVCIEVWIAADCVCESKLSTHYIDLP